MYGARVPSVVAEVAAVGPSRAVAAACSRAVGRAFSLNRARGWWSNLPGARFCAFIMDTTHFLRYMQVNWSQKGASMFYGLTLNTNSRDTRLNAPECTFYSLAASNAQKLGAFIWGCCSGH